MKKATLTDFFKSKTTISSNQAPSATAAVSGQLQQSKSNLSVQSSAQKSNKSTSKTKSPEKPKPQVIKSQTQKLPPKQNDIEMIVEDKAAPKKQVSPSKQQQDTLGSSPEKANQAIIEEEYEIGVTKRRRLIRMIEDNDDEEQSKQSLKRPKPEGTSHNEVNSPVTKKRKIIAEDDEEVVPKAKVLSQKETKQQPSQKSVPQSPQKQSSQSQLKQQPTTQKPEFQEEDQDQLMDLDENELLDALSQDKLKPSSQLNKIPSQHSVTKQDIKSQGSEALSYSAFQMKQKSPQKITLPSKSPLKPSKSSGDPTTCLNGLKFVVTGEFDKVSRDKIQEIILTHGGAFVTSVSKKVNILLVGRILSTGQPPETSNKYKEALNLKTQIMREDEFEALMQQKTGNENFTLDGKPRKRAQESAEMEEEMKIEPPKINQETGQLIQVTDMWTDLYQPKSRKDLVGNEGLVNQLEEWLKDWDDIHIRGNKKTFRGGAPMGRGGYMGGGGSSWQNMPNVNAKAVLLSGPPGIGKTSAAKIMCNELGFEVLETNASDTRNKNSIQNMLKDLSSNTSLDYFSLGGIKRANENSNAMIFGGASKKKSVIIMDEVDGVGAGDRGGIAALIAVIKQSKTPIICICNDRMNKKLASLVNHCLDLKFLKPTKDQIIKRLRRITFEQGLEINRATLEQIVESSGNDLRQIINILQMWKNHQMDTGFLKQITKDESVMISNFDAAHRMLDHGQKSLHIKYPEFRHKMDLFFIDYDFIPMLVQENYLSAMGERKSLQDVEAMAAAADFISLGDSINVQVRTHQDWSLLSNLGMASAIGPALIIEGTAHYPRFPEWLGKNSSSRKCKRQIRELKAAMGYHAQASRMELQNEYVDLILREIYKRLQNGKDQVSEAVDFMADLGITNEIFKEHLMSLSMDQKLVKDFESLETGVKSAFTREYNKKYAFNATGVTKKIGGKGTATKSSKGGDEGTMDNGDQSGEDEEEEVIEDEDQDELLDEDQIAELRKGRQLVKEQAEKSKKEKVTKFELLQLTSQQTGGGNAKAKSQQAKKGENQDGAEVGGAKKAKTKAAAKKK